MLYTVKGVNATLMRSLSDNESLELRRKQEAERILAERRFKNEIIGMWRCLNRYHRSLGIPQ